MGRPWVHPWAWVAWACASGMGGRCERCAEVRWSLPQELAGDGSLAEPTVADELAWLFTSRSLGDDHGRQPTRAAHGRAWRPTCLGWSREPLFAGGLAGGPFHTHLAS